MMHHPNIHHQAMSGHPPQHMPAHQGMAAHHQMPPHQMHRENRHVTLTRVPLGPSGMSHGPQGMGMVHHQRAPHPIRPMHHHNAPHHAMPPQMKPVRRQYMGYSGVYTQPEPRPEPATQHNHTGPSTRKPPQQRTVPQQRPVTGLSKGAALSRALQTKPVPDTAPRGTRMVIPPHLLKGQKPIIKRTSASATPTSNNTTHVREPPTATVPSATGSATGGASSSATGGAPSGAGDGAGAEAERALASVDTPQANSKEKTPMCLVNELARYNKIKHQYRLTSETGPAHKKVFTVTLRLGDTEEYTAEGSSIKRAQHAAASAALTATSFPPPPPRAAAARLTTHPHHRHSGAVMPTVELNALAMKLCQPAVYAAVGAGGGAIRGAPRPRPPYPRLPFVPPYQRMMGPQPTYRVRVSVGGRAWLGEGSTPQAARHDAAARALQELRPAPSATLATAAATRDDNHDGSGDASADILNSDGVKSPVSLVHELALKRNLCVTFSVKSERGPPHMRVFITTCTVGEMETEGEGNGKKVSKRRAAERMLEEMRRRWPPALLRARPAHQPRAHAQPKKKPRNLIKEGVGSTPEGGGGGADNPISRLAVARHAARARSPQYRVIEERGAARRREFLVQCDAPPHRATGLGPNKKTAKRRAAHNVLLAMEAAGECPASPSAPAAATVNSPADTANTTDTKRKETEASAGGASSEVRQPVPGVLLMDYHQRTGQPLQPNGVSETSATGGAGSAPGAKDQLMYLSQLLGFTVQFSDFPKRNHGEYLSLVSLSTVPPVMCHGGGLSTAHSHEQCARAALRALKLMGLDAPDTTLPNSPASATVPPAINGVTE